MSDQQAVPPNSMNQQFNEGTPAYDANGEQAGIVGESDLVGNRLTETAPSDADGLISQGIDVIEQSPDTVTQGVSVIEQAPHTVTQGVSVIDQAPDTYPKGSDTIEPEADASVSDEV